MARPRCPRRGAVAVIAAVFWAALFLSSLRGLPRMIAWSRAHPVLDSLVMIPAGFLGAATLTRLGLGWCALIAVLLWLVVLVGGTRRRRRLRCGPTAAGAPPHTGAPTGGGTPLTTEWCFF